MGKEVGPTHMPLSKMEPEHVEVLKTEINDHIGLHVTGINLPEHRIGIAYFVISIYPRHDLYLGGR